MPAGRPPIYKTPEDMQEAIDFYFQECADKEEPLTISGLAYALDMTTESLRRYSAKDEFSATVKRAKQKVEQSIEKRAFGNNAAGAIFNLKCNFGWKDTQYIEENSTQRVTKEIVFKPAKMDDDS